MRRTPLEAWIASKIGLSGRPLVHADIEAWQIERRREMLAFVREASPFYRHHLGGPAPDVRQLADWARLPFTTAEDIRANPLQFICGSQDTIQRIVTLDTTGTTGRPKRVAFTQTDQALTVDFFRIGMSTFTQAGDRVLIGLPYTTPGSVGDLLATALREIGAVAVTHGPITDPAATLDRIDRESIDVIVGVPVHLLALVRQKKQPTHPIKSVLFATDYTPTAIRRAVEKTWRCTTFDHYGMTEMGLGGGVECAAQRGYHLREADMYFEIVDPASGQVLPDGQYGEVVFTTLTRHGMPLIRYRTGDVSRFVPGDCPCGTCLKTLERVNHRLDGLVALDHHRLAMADLDEYLFSIDGVLNFNAKVVNKQGKDWLCLEIQHADNQHGTGDSASRLITERIQQLYNFAVEVSLVNAIPLRMTKRIITDGREGQ